jgi:hypothetical protein
LNSACQRGAIPACFQVLLPSSAFFHPFTLSLYLSSQCGMFLLGNKWIGLFLIKHTRLCLLVGQLRH